MVMEDYMLLTRVFSRTVIKDLVINKCNKFVKKAAEEFLPQGEYKYSETFELLYNVLRKRYRNEYYYKNTLINNRLFGIYSPTTTTALTEVQISNSKADFIFLNGKAVVYEIKTELDNLDRLSNQISNYYSAFDGVSIITCEQHVDKIYKNYGQGNVGIYILNSRGNIQTIKPPNKNRDALSFDCMFAILRKNEYESIVKHFYGNLPSTSQFQYYDTCKNLLRDVNIDDFYDKYIAVLKGRGDGDGEYYEDIPKSIRFISYFSHLNEAQKRRLKNSMSATL